MTADTAQQQADALHRLHSEGKPLVLVNAWDAASARLLEQAGASVIATTSAGMAWSLGYADGEKLPRDELIAACARICRVVRVPVTVDIERGFGRSTDEVCSLVRALIDLGVVGVNIEDGVSPETRRPLPPQALCERVSALRALAVQAKVRLFINARTDVYLATHDDPARRFEEAMQRARLFAAAGADGIFVPGMDKTRRDNTLRARTRTTIECLCRVSRSASHRCAEWRRRAARQSWMWTVAVGTQSARSHRGR